MKNALDKAFMRRIRFVVQFPFPDLAQRAEIWTKIFPANTPKEGLNMEQLAKLNLSGGNIRNIALNAAFLAAEEDKPVLMCHISRAAKSEHLKLEKPFSSFELK
jgi:ATP-dependent 26S proteasome regulatory subunit